MSFLLFLVQLVLYYLFLVAAVILCTIQIATYLFIWPFNKSLYRRLNYYLAYLLWGNVTCFAQHWAPTKLNIYMKEDDYKMLGKENIVCVLNHKYTVDWLMGWLISQNIGLLGGCKVFLKNTLKYVPLLGWSFAFTEQIFVKRVWETDSKTLKKDLGAIFEEYPSDLKYCVVIFCEGTRFSKEKYEASMEVAKQKNFPLLKHHLLPRTKGFEMLMTQVDKKVEYLYDMTLMIDDVDGEVANMRHIKNRVGLNVHAFFRRIPISNLNLTDSVECSKFVHQLYREKDEIFDTYKTTGNFDKYDVKKFPVKKNYIDLFNAIWMGLLILIPSAYYFFELFMNSSLLVKVVLGLALVSTNYAIEFLMYYTDPRYASKFGLKEKKEK